VEHSPSNSSLLLSARKAADAPFNDKTPVTKDCSDKPELQMSKKVENANKIEQDTIAGEEELKFAPKPPSDVSFVRRNSLTRRGSMRRRHNSGSTVIISSNESQDTCLSSGNDLLLSGPRAASEEGGIARSPRNADPKSVTVLSVGDHIDCTLPDGIVSKKAVVGGGTDIKEIKNDKTRSRSREIRSGTKTERRSSSLGANLRQPSAEKQRPPVSVAAGNIRQSSSSSAMENLSSAKSERTAGTYKFKNLLGHKR
jgi:hypothetical protein